MKVGLIGLGYWGKILHSKLEKICDVEFTCRSKDTYLDKLDGVDWVFVSTPNDTHYEIVRNCLWFGKNVFCEKPLTLTQEQSEKLYEFAEMRNVKLYVDDIQNYRNYDFKIMENNLVERRKLGGNLKDVLYMLTYHDLYVLYKYVKYSEIEDIILIDNKSKLHFKIKFSDISIEFIYDLNSKKREHYINGCSLAGDDDILSKMLSDVLNNKVDFDYNKEVSLFANKMIDIIGSKVWKS